MKNLIFAIGGLTVVIVVIFMFASKQKVEKETVIPSPISVESPQPSFIFGNETSSSVAALPFPILKKDEIESKKITIVTDKGDIVLKLSENAPIASSNFIFLAGKKFYDGVIFHRVIKGFMIQGGDPKGDGTGGPGYAFADEKVNMDYKRGTVAMANAGSNTNGSQFFIMHQDYQLPRNYTIFGLVLSGMDVVDMIANSQVDENDKPIRRIVMSRVTVE